MPEVGDIQYNSPNNVQVYGSDNNYHRAQLVATAAGDVKYSDPDVSPNVQVMGSDGNYHRAILVALDGGGGSDSHNMGWYADETSLTTAHPTGEDGDYAIVGSTDTIWVWDGDNNEWVDTDRKGQVESVNNMTGQVTLTASDVGAQPVPTIVNTSGSTPSISLVTNNIYNCGTLTSIAFTTPLTPTVDFNAQVNFTSGATATTVTPNDNIVWVGDNVSETQGFVPRANCRYVISFMYDGTNIRGIIQGISIA